MFVYELELYTSSYYNAKGNFKFDPPLYEQRYTTITRILEDEAKWHCKFKKVVDFGCAELRLLPLLRNTNGLQHILAVDIDEQLLIRNLNLAKPLMCDYIKKRYDPLRIEVLCGSIAEPAEQLQNVDAVIAVELIEHLHANELSAVPANVFGFIKPRLAIFTTPNSEFNVMFNPLLPNGMRHLDHKFEWTRAEFKQWAQDICDTYTNYDFALMGLGVTPQNYTNDIGYCTQVAIFARKDLLQESPPPPPPQGPLPSLGDASQTASVAQNLPKYKEIYVADFPYEPNKPTQETKIWNEAQYHIERYKRMNKYYVEEQRIHKIPLEVLAGFTEKVHGDLAQLRLILPANGFKIEGEYVLAPEDEWEYEEDDCYQSTSSASTHQLPIDNNYESGDNWDD